MNKNELKDDIKNAVEDIRDDFDIYRTRDYTNREATPEEYAVMRIVLPQIFGIIIGCAVARFFHFGLAGYIITGVIFAFLVGLHKSTYNDKISLKYAVIKNIVLILIEFVSVMLFAGIYGIIYMTG